MMAGVEAQSYKWVEAIEVSIVGIKGMKQVAGGAG